MNQQSTKGPRTALSRSQQAALVKLLGDDDESVVQSIRDTIFSYGAGAQSWLEPYLLDNDPRVRSRVRQVVHELGRKAADTEFLSFCIGSGEDLDIEQGEWLLARTRHPEINTAGYQAVIDSFAADLQREIDPASGAEGILATINNYLFERQVFFGNEEEYYDP